MNAKRRLEYLDAIGIQVWQSRSDTVSPVERIGEEDGDCVVVEEPGAHDAERTECTRSDIDDTETRWLEVQARASACTACELHRTRTQTVFGMGSRAASWMVIGEAPGASEDQQGEPFVGRAGQLLDEMLRAIGQHRSEVFITNILKCRPPQNRDPKPAEVEACENFLKAQVDLLQPRIILAVGRIAAQNLLKSDAPLSRLRGKMHRFGDIPLVVVYHPAYLLRSPLEKRKAWGDLQFALEVAGNQQDNRAGVE